MKLKFPFAIAFLIIVIFSGCDDDFSTLAPYKDITIVYGILSQNDQSIYLKINKAFLGPGDAITYAGEADSMNYNYLLEVKVYEYTPEGNLNRTFIFDTTSLYNKKEGIFTSEQTLYFYRFPDGEYAEIIEEIGYPYYDTIIEKYWLFDNHSYHLEIYNPVLDKYITSETKLIHNFNLYPRFTEITIDTSGYSTTFSWSEDENGPSPENTSLSHFELNFSYVEIYNGGDSDTLSIALAEAYLSDVNSYTYLSANFYQSCLKQIPYQDQELEDLVQLRKLNSLDITITIASEEFHKYLNAYQHGFDFYQENFIYTNINNGIGIFSSRFKKKINKHIKPEASLPKLREFEIKF